MLEAGVFLWGVFAYWMLKVNLANGYPFENGNTYFFNQMTFLGITTACFSGFFIGTEYSDGTMRNKLSVGHSRAQVYLANLTVVLCVGLAQFAAYALAASTVGALLVGGVVWNRLYRPAETIALSVLSIATNSAIAVVVSMVVTEKARAVLVNVLLSILLLAAGASALRGMMQPETVKRIYLAETQQYRYVYEESMPKVLNDASLVVEEVPNPKYLRGVERKIYACVCAVLPTAQALSCALDDSSFVRFSVFHVLGTLAAVTVLSGAGILIFWRKDLK